MVKDANEARCLTISTHDSMIKAANVDSILKKIEAACIGGQYCCRIYELISIPNQLKLNELGFTIEPGSGGGDEPPSYVVSWYQELRAYQEVVTNG